MDDPGSLPPKLLFLDRFFGENVLFHQFNPTNTPKCYTWLESYGSSLRDGNKKKIFFPPCEASDFRGRSQTDFLHDLRARHTLSRECIREYIPGDDIGQICPIPSQYHPQYRPFGPPKNPQSGQI